MTETYPFFCKICGKTTDRTELVCLDDYTDYFICRTGCGCQDITVAGKIGFVYRWTKLETGQYYIGSHKGYPHSDNYISSSKIFNRAVRKHGIEKFTRDILYQGEEYKEKEENFLKILDAANDPNSYNLKNEAFGATLPGDKNGMWNKKHSSETKTLISMHSITHSDKFKKEHSKRMSGSGNPMYGKSHSLFSMNKSKNTKIKNNIEWEFLQSKQHQTIFRKIYYNLDKYGVEQSPRNLKTKELENFYCTFPPYVRFANFSDRKLNINYIKTEFVWYLKGNSFDTSITTYAKKWNEMINSDGTINSNYGQYIFGSINQFDDVVRILSEDKDSRRAAIVILSYLHLKMITKDVPCTYAISFRIRDNKLNMSVKMRSQDSWFGFGSDIPTFSFVHEMLFNMLKDVYKELEYGEYFHSVDSFHVYEPQFARVHNIARGYSAYALVYCPKINSSKEVVFLRNRATGINSPEFEIIPEEFKFTKWLYDTEEKK